MAETSRPGKKRKHAAATVVSVAVHLGLFAGVLLAIPKSKPVADAPSTALAFLDLPRPERPKAAEPKPPRPASPKPPGPNRAKAAPARTPVPKPPPRQSLTRPVVARPDTPPVSPVRAAGTSADVSDAELAGATTTGGGGGGGGGGGEACNMLARLEAGLRKDQLVQSAARAGSSGKAVRVWNGDWVQGTGEDGKGMAAVREAILWEVGFAPKECREQRVHGLVLVTLNDGPGSPRFAMGAGEWRWSDLLALRSGPR